MPSSGGIHGCILLLKVTGYRAVGMVSNKTFLPFSSSANAQKLLTTLETSFLKGFIGF